MSDISQVCKMLNHQKLHTEEGWLELSYEITYGVEDSRLVVNIPSSSVSFVFSDTGQLIGISNYQH